MSTAVQTGGRRRGAALRRGLPLALVVAAALLAAALAGPAADGAPLDPRSTGAAGTKALVDTVRALGVEVVLDAPALTDEVARALVLLDDLDDDERDAARGWVERGGVLVVADSRSPLVPAVVGTAAVGGIGIAELSPDCPLPALADVAAVLPERASAVYELPEGAVGCFPRNGGHWLVAEPVGAGVVVALGGPEAWLNANLGEASHPELAAALLAPEADGTLALLRTRLPGEGDATLADLIGDNVRLFALQLLVALALLVAWRARRLGRPVEEPQPVEIPGSELVTAVGNLYHEGGDRERATELLRGDLRRTLEERLGLPRGTAPEVLADAVAARTGAPADDLAALLSPGAPADEAALVAFAQEIERLRDQALHAPAPATTRRSQ